MRPEVVSSVKKVADRAAFPLLVWPEMAVGRRFSAKMCCQAAVSHRVARPSRTVSEVGRRQQQCDFSYSIFKVSV